MKHREFTFESGTLGRFFKRHGITWNYRFLNTPPRRPGASSPLTRSLRGMRHFEIVLFTGEGVLGFTYSTPNMAEEPDIEEAVRFLAETSLMLEKGQREFEAYARTMGADPEDPAFLDWHYDLAEMADKLRELLGSDDYYELLSTI